MFLDCFFGFWTFAWTGCEYGLPLNKYCYFLRFLGVCRDTWCM